MRKLKILCDMDGIITDLIKKWIAYYNDDYGEKLTTEDIRHWRMSANVKIGNKIHDYLYVDGFFRDLEPLPGAINALSEMKKMGHEVYIVTAPSWPGTSAQDKISWVREHMPFIKKRDIFLGHNKHMIKGDVFIDDSPENLKEYRQAWPESSIFTIAYPYSWMAKDVVNLCAEDYRDTAKAWDTILGAVSTLGE